MAELKLCSLHVESERAAARQQQQLQPPARPRQPPPVFFDDSPGVSLAGEAHFLPPLGYSTQSQLQQDRGADNSLSSQFVGGGGARPALGSGGLFHSPPRSPDRRAAFEARAQPSSLSHMTGPWAVPSYAIDQSLAADSLLIFPETVSDVGRGTAASPGNPVASSPAQQSSGSPSQSPLTPQAWVPEEITGLPPYSDDAFDRFKTADALPNSWVGSRLRAQQGASPSQGAGTSAAAVMAVKEPVPYAYAESTPIGDTEDMQTEADGGAKKASQANLPASRCASTSDRAT